MLRATHFDATHSAGSPAKQDANRAGLDASFRHLCADVASQAPPTEVQNR